ncbi:NlpC/P60 family protein (plasmid) [Enterocloster clostridioformis]
MVSLLYKSKNVIPFCEGGRYWKTEFPAVSGGANHIPDSGSGVDSLGFVMWAYYAIFQEYIDEPSHAYRLGNRISIKDLRPGDIGMMEYAADKPNHYGIFLGYDNEIPVFAHCSSFPFPGFPGGGVKLCSIDSSESKEKLYMGSPAEQFQYFTRPDVMWETDQNHEPLSELIAADPPEDNAANRSYAEFGTYLYDEWTAGNYESIFNLLNNEEAEKRGYQINKVQFIEQAEKMRQEMTGKSIRVYNSFQLSEGAVVVRYCLAGLKTDSTGKEWVADTIHCKWLDLTLYKKNGTIKSFLPFNAVMFETAVQYGYIQK